MFLLVNFVESRHSLDSDLSAKMNWWCYTTNRPACAGALSMSQPCRSGILWQIICVIRLLNLAALGVSQRHFCLHGSRHNVPSALEIYDYGLCKVIYYLLIFYLLIPLSRLCGSIRGFATQPILGRRKAVVVLRKVAEGLRFDCGQYGSFTIFAVYFIVCGFLQFSAVERHECESGII